MLNMGAELACMAHNSFIWCPSHWFLILYLPSQNSKKSIFFVEPGVEPAGPCGSF